MRITAAGIMKKGCNGSISEVITLDTPCSGDERNAEPICCLISSVFSSQFGKEPIFGPVQITK
jgi:hypothetical protein